jgi:uncharacterized protein YdeI (YjbR/CyaY-like superfamily)
MSTEVSGRLTGMHLPRNLAAALRADPQALHYFECLPDIQQRLIVLRVEERYQSSTPSSLRIRRMIASELA